MSLRLKVSMLPRRISSHCSRVSTFDQLFLIKFRSVLDHVYTVNIKSNRLLIQERLDVVKTDIYIERNHCKNIGMVTPKH